MSEPVPRLEPLAPEIARLLEQERARPDPSAAAAERVLARLGQSVLALPLQAPPSPPSASTGLSHPPAATAPAVRAAAGTAKIVGVALVAALGGAGTGAGLHAALREPKTVLVFVPQGVPPPAPEPIALPVPPEPAADPAEPVRPVAPTRPASRPSRPAVVEEKTEPPAVVERERDRELAAERALIEQARTALARDKSADALAALAEHAREHPRGQLEEEREALQILALTASGRVDEARAGAARFRERFPRSVHWHQIRAALGTER